LGSLEVAEPWSHWRWELGSLDHWKGRNLSHWRWQNPGLTGGGRTQVSRSLVSLASLGTEEHRSHWRPLEVEEPRSVRRATHHFQGLVWRKKTPCCA